jgi:hypothetical protein
MNRVPRFTVMHHHRFPMIMKIKRIDLPKEFIYECSVHASELGPGSTRR